MKYLLTSEKLNDKDWNKYYICNNNIFSLKKYGKLKDFLYSIQQNQ